MNSCTRLFLYPLVALLVAAAFSPVLTAQEIGSVRLLGQFTPPTGGGYTAGCWGWTDTSSGREYAILGNQAGTAFVEITDVGAMVERDFVPGVSSSWREVQVHDHYAYVVSEGGDGTQIIDLSYLPDSVHHVKNYVHTSGGKNTIRAHSLHIRDGFMYLNGCANWSPGGVLIFDLADPENPSYKGEYAGVYIHDCFVRNDTIYGAGIYNQGIKIIDATTKTAPSLIHTINYTGSGTHNLATTNDGKYVLSTDEIGTTAKTLKIWDLATDVKVAEYAGSPTAIVHNVFVLGDLAIMSYYTAGMRVVDITNPASPVELGGYDTRPGSEAASYTGAWSVYPFFPSGKIIIGDMGQGMYVVELNTNSPNPPNPFSAYSDYLTPTSVTLNWTDPTELGGGGPLTNFKLHIFRGSTYIAEVDSGVETYTDAGLTNHLSYTYTIRAVTATDSSNVSMTSVYAGGHAQPKPPTSFAVNDVIGANRLTWINPSRQLDNTPLNDLAYVLVYRDGMLYDSIAQGPADTGQARMYDDTGLGFHSYSIRVRDNETPVHQSTMSVTASGFGGLFTEFTETFDSASITYQTIGAWDTTSAIAAHGTHSLTDSRVGPYYPGATVAITFPRVILTSTPLLRFSHIALVAFGDIAYVEISNDNRQTFHTLKVYNIVGHTQWEDSSADPGDWETETFDLAPYAHDTVNVRFRLVSNPDVQLDGWYLDDIYIGDSHEPVEVQQNTSNGWNIVSLPVLVDDGSTGTLFPGATTQAYAYDAGYVAEDTLRNGAGYWLKFDSASVFDYNGYTILIDTIGLAAGWNLIGTLGEDIPAAEVSSTPGGIIATPFYEYDAGYVASPTLEAGKGYWVKAASPGGMILSVFTAKVPAEAAAVSPAAEGPPEGSGTLTITDASGRRAFLYLNEDPAADALLPAYELPPVPPPGAFDVRFGTQRSLEVLSADAMARIETQGLLYPVRVSWNSPGGTGLRLAADRVIRNAPDGGSIVLDRAPVSLSAGPGSRPASSVPTEYALDQNYPNPFNPSTVIGFRLPEGGDVRLEIFNTIGQKVGTIVRESLPAGSYRRTWEATSDGRELPGGVYHALLSVHDGGVEKYRASRKLLLVR